MGVADASFEEILEQAIALLRRRRRITYRGLKRQLGIDEDLLQDIAQELIKGQRLAQDEDGEVLIWSGQAGLQTDTAAGVPPATRPGLSPAAELQLDTGAERRQVTVMFCDLVGSTALSTRLDPEDLRELIRSYQDLCGRIVSRYGGYVARYLGDGIMVYFGYPRAHEDDAERAVQAGLAITESVGSIRTADNEALQVRVGIATGLAVVGDLIGAEASLERAVVGETPNLAARLQSRAGPDSVVVGKNTRILIGELFEVEDLGSCELKGIAESVQAWRVLRKRPVESRFEAAYGGAPETPLIGRQQELTVLTACWERAAAGRAQMALLTGEPGIGKSRLVQALRARVATVCDAVMGLQCSSYHCNSAFYPFIEYLVRACRFEPEDGAGVRLDKLEAVLRPSSPNLAESAQVLAALLSVSTAERYPPLNLTPQVQKRRIQEAIVEHFAARFGQHPALCILEDAHWLDPSSQELFDLLLGRARELPVLFIATDRLDFTPTWNGHDAVTRIKLERLGSDQCAALARAAAGDAELTPAVLQQILVKTDGVPLFIEELTKGALASEHSAGLGPVGSSGLGMPTTLQDSLMARLEQGAPVRSVAQVGAAIGRSFSFVLLALVCSMEHSELERALAKLVDAKLIQGQGKPPHANYSFKHALVQDAAYSSLLLSRREQLHRAIGRALVDSMPETAEAQAEVVAQHFDQAHMPREAFAHWLRAGKRAMQGSANVEAVRHFRAGMTALDAIPDGPERLGMELEIRTLLGVVLMAVQGYAAQDVLDNFARARELCDMLGDAPQVFVVVFGLWLFNLVRADRQAVPELAEQLLAMAGRADDPSLRVQAEGVGAVTKFYQGEHTAVIRHAERALELYDPKAHGNHVFIYGDDPGIYAHIYRGLSLFFQGYPDQAWLSLERALRLAEEIAHPFSIAGALAFSTQMSYLRREPQRTEALAERTIALSAEQGFLLFQAVGMLYRGWPAAQRGDAGAGIEHIRSAVALFRETGARLNGHYFMSHLAEACLAAGRDEEAERALDEAGQLAAVNLDTYYVAELQRQRGELMLSRGDADAAAICFTDAYEEARSAGARSLELRAATSMARLAAVQRHARSRRSPLEDIYAWFTEGFDTGDLRAARALISEIRASG